MRAPTNPIDLNEQGYSVRFTAGGVEYVAIGTGDGSILLLASTNQPKVFVVQPSAMNSVYLIPLPREEAKR